MLTRTSAAPLAAGRELFQGTACEMRCFLRAGSGRLRGASPAESGAGGRASPGHGLRPQQAAVPVPLPTAAGTKGQQPASPELPGPPSPREQDRFRKQRLETGVCPEPPQPWACQEEKQFPKLRGPWREEPYIPAACQPRGILVGFLELLESF